MLFSKTKGKLMQNSDSFTKFLLILLVIGVWGLLIKSFFPDSSIQTQSKRQYIIGAIDEQGRIRFDGGGNSIALTATGLSIALSEVSKEGLKVNSILTPSSGGYVVIVEK
jgi:hypothetical protein